MNKFIQVRVDTKLNNLTDQNADLRGLNRSDYIRWLIEHDNTTDIGVVRRKVLSALETLAEAIPAYLHTKYNVLKLEEQKRIFGELDIQQAKESDILVAVINRLKKLPDDDKVHKAELQKLKKLFECDTIVLACIDKMITKTDGQKTL